MDKPIPEIGGTLREKALAAIDATRWVPRAGPQPHPLDDRDAARLVHLAPARLGRADRASSSTRRPASRCATRRGRPHRRGLRDARAPMPGSTPARATSSATTTTPPTTSRSPTSSMSGSIRGSTHAFVLEERPDLQMAGRSLSRRLRPASRLVPFLAAGSCGTRGRAPYEAVLTHGFVLDEQGRKMSKSLGNVTAPQDVMRPERRRHPAPLGGRHRLHRGPAHRPGDPEVPGRRLSPAAQHLALSAGRLDGFTAAERVPPAGDAGTRALGAASPGRARRGPCARRSTTTISTRIVHGAP